MAIQAGDILWTVDANVKKFEAAIKKSQAKIQGVGKALTGIGAVGTAAFGSVATSALRVADQVDGASKKMVASLGLPSDVADDFAEKIKTVYGNNFGGSIEDVGESMTAVFQQFSRVTDDAFDNIENLTEATISIADAFDVDVNEAASAAATLMENFGISSDKALDMVAAGFQRGLNAQDDFLDSIGEYSVQFAEGGASAEEFFSLLQTGLQGGMLGTDKAADLFKEFRVRIQDGSKGVSEALESIGISSRDFLGELADGSMTAAEAFQQVQEGLRNADNSTLQFQAGVALLGTQFEDLGASAALAIDTTNFAIVEGQEGVAGLSQQYDTLASALEGLRRKVMMAIEPLGSALLQIVNQYMPVISGVVDRISGWISSNGQLAATITIVGGIISGLALALGPLLIALPGIVAGFSAFTGALSAASGPVIALAVAIGGALVVALMNLRPIMETAKSWIVGNWERIKQTFEIAKETLSSVMQAIGSVLGAAFQVISGILVGFVQGNMEAWSGISSSASEGTGDFLGNVQLFLKGAGEWANSITEVFGKVSQWLSDNWQTIVDGARWASKWLVTPLVTIIKIFGRVAGFVVQAVGRIVNAIARLKEAVANAGDAVASLLGFSQGGIVPGFAQGGLIPAYAQGGQTQSRIVKVGERGPELVSLPVGSRVMTNNDMMRAVQQGSAMAGGLVGAAAGGINVTLNVNGAGESDPDRLLEKVKGPLSRWLADEYRKARR